MIIAMQKSSHRDLKKYLRFSIIVIFLIEAWKVDHHGIFKMKYQWRFLIWCESWYHLGAIQDILLVVEVFIEQALY